MWQTIKDSPNPGVFQRYPFVRARDSHSIAELIFKILTATGGGYPLGVERSVASRFAESFMVKTNEGIPSSVPANREDCLKHYSIEDFCVTSKDNFAPPAAAFS
ncbi:hypothetical protein P167DRAFT_546047 [Morchella conica CCBAS932]|uniref:Uncharacterized protein n=1 Tax=Morchella conica CCBAS932 TaxID=1392247 RepID=A0A3N4L188_9PEZI|nr:hypothetical protein P167DRAFT_546047 [Morchella conica CCBAS932]